MPPAPRTVAITGATGLVGAALGRSLRSDGHTVVPLVRGASRDPRAARWDPAAGTIEAGALTGVEAVVHLAGAGIGDRRWSAARKREILESRTRGTRLVARTIVALDPPPTVLVSASAVGYYGDRGDEVLTEASPPGDDFVAEVVQAWEASTEPAVDAGMRTIWLRTAPVLAREGGLLPRMALPFRLFVGGRLGSGRQWMSWITLEDTVRAIRLVLDGDLAGPVNVTSPHPVTNAEMSRAIGRVLHRPSAIPVPAPVLRLVLGREMADTVVLTSQRVHPGVLTGVGFAYSHPDIATALEATLGGRR
jgi:uncharacterized protein (TIGR01777 family)